MSTIQMSPQIVDEQTIKAYLQVQTLDQKDLRGLLSKIVVTVANPETGTMPINSKRIELFQEINNTYSKKDIKGDSMCILNSKQTFVQKILKQKENLQNIGIDNICILSTNEVWFITDTVTVSRILELDRLCTPLLRGTDNRPRYMLIAKANISDKRWSTLTNRIEV